jgi:hypothetical protein
MVRFEATQLFQSAMPVILKNQVRVPVFKKSFYSISEAIF